jgi:KaiC/GvpD/RAD55 family RecA-like ATPase
MTQTYRFEDVLTDAVLSRHRDLLVAGPSRETVRPVPTRILAGAVEPGDGAALVTTRDAARTLLDRVARDVPGLERDRLGVVDCTPTHDVVRANPRERHWSVPSPTDLTGASMAINECLETLRDAGVDRRHLLFDSLSTLLLSADAETVFRYAHQVLLSGGATGLSLFPVYTNVTDGTDFERLKHLFDGMVRVRRRAGGREVRFVGVDGTPAGWLRLDAAAE